MYLYLFFIILFYFLTYISHEYKQLFQCSHIAELICIGLDILEFLIGLELLIYNVQHIKCNKNIFDDLLYFDFNFNETYICCSAT